MKKTIYILSISLGFAGSLLAKPAAPQDPSAVAVTELARQAKDQTSNAAARALATEKLIALIEINELLEKVLPKDVDRSSEIERTTAWTKIVTHSFNKVVPQSAERLNRLITSPDLIVQQQAIKEIIRIQTAEGETIQQPTSIAQSIEMAEVAKIIDNLYLQAVRVRPMLINVYEESEISRPLIREVLTRMDEVGSLQ